MAINTAGLRHQHLRKRTHEKLEPYPHPNKYKRTLDKIIYVIAFLGPILTLPQVIKLLTTKNAGGISFITFAGYTAVSFIWFLYGIAHKEKPIAISQGLFTLLHAFIAIAALIY